VDLFQISEQHFYYLFRHLNIRKPMWMPCGQCL